MYKKLLKINVTYKEMMKNFRKQSNVMPQEEHIVVFWVVCVCACVYVSKIINQCFKWNHCLKKYKHEVSVTWQRCRLFCTVVKCGQMTTPWKRGSEINNILYNCNEILHILMFLRYSCRYNHFTTGTFRSELIHNAGPAQTIMISSAISGLGNQASLIACGARMACIMSK